MLRNYVIREIVCKNEVRIISVEAKQINSTIFKYKEEMHLQTMPRLAKIIAPDLMSTLHDGAWTYREINDIITIHCASATSLLSYS